MATTSFPEDPNQSPPRLDDELITPPQLDDELIGLDPDDPETQAFAAHLRRHHSVHPSYTVEGYLSDVGEFADSANRLGGHRKLMAGILVFFILLGMTITAWDTLVYLWHTFTR